MARQQASASPFDEVSLCRAGEVRLLQRIEALTSSAQTANDPELKQILARHTRCLLERQLPRWQAWARDTAANLSAPPRTEQAPANPPAPVEDPSTIFQTEGPFPPVPPATSAATKGQPVSGQGYSVQVLSCLKVTPDLRIFTSEKPAGFSYRAGQYAKVGYQGLRRSYTLVSAPHQPELEFFVELQPQGRMSAALRALQPGDRLVLPPQAKGGMQLDLAVPLHVMVATVTGVNPFVSLLRDYFAHQRPQHRLYLLHGASYQDEFGYRQELQELARQYPETLTYLPTVSRPEENRNAGWQGETGRVDAVLDRLMARLNPNPATTRLYACGHPTMVDKVEQDYTRQNFTIEVERY